MSQEALFCFFMRLIEFYFSIDSSLFPEHWYWASNLKMWETIIVDDNNLLSFTKVRYLTFSVQSSCIISCSTFFKGSSCDEIILNFFSLIRVYYTFEVDFEVLNRALDDSSEPGSVIKFEQCLSHMKIPCILKFSRISFCIGLPREGQIIIIWEVITFLE